MREPLPAPSRFPPFPTGIVSAGALPSSAHSLYESAGAAGALEALARLTGLEVPALLRGDPRRTAFPFRGGEAEGLRRLQAYLHGEPGLGSLSLQDVSHSDAALRQENVCGGFASPGAELGHDRGGVACCGNGLARGGEASVSGTATSSLPAGSAGGADPEKPAPGNADKASAAGDAGRQGGESQAAGRAPIHSFRDTRMGAVGVNNSLKLSAYLASGCLSPRMVHAAVAAAREARGEDTGHSWVVMHLTIRLLTSLPPLMTRMRNG